MTDTNADTATPPAGTQTAALYLFNPDVSDVGEY